MTIALAFALGVLAGAVLGVLLMCLMALAGREAARERGE